MLVRLAFDGFNETFMLHAAQTDRRPRSCMSDHDRPVHALPCPNHALRNLSQDCFREDPVRTTSLLHGDISESSMLAMPDQKE